MIRLGLILVLGSILISTRAPAQLPPASHSWEPTAAQDRESILSRQFPRPSAAGIISRVSTSSNLYTFQPVPVDSSRRHKSPVLAWFLSWLIPGGGQGYNGQWTKAVAFFVPAAVGLGLAASDDGFSCSGDCGTRDAGLVILAAASIGSQIEAPIAASKINREGRQRASLQVRLTVASFSF
jgi:hypothetical protein